MAYLPQHNLHKIAWFPIKHVSALLQNSFIAIFCTADTIDSCHQQSMIRQFYLPDKGDSKHDLPSQLVVLKPLSYKDAKNHQ